MEYRGYSYKNTIYLNKELNELERINKHELLHFFTNNDTFKLIRSSFKFNESLRKEYVRKYMKLYSSNDDIDDEIIIDYLVDNYEFEFSNGLVINGYNFGDKKELEEKRYLVLNMKQQIKDMNLTTWEKIFVINYYDSLGHIMPHGKEKYITIREDIKNSLNRLYDVALNPDAFLLDPHSPEVIRDYDNELSILVTAGEDTSLFIANRDKILE